MEGTWKNNNDGMKLVSDSGKIVLNFNAKQVNIVADGDTVLKIQYDGDSIPIAVSYTHLTLPTICSV